MRNIQFKFPILTFAFIFRIINKIAKYLKKHCNRYSQENMFEDTTVLIISRKSTDNKMFKRKRTKVQTHIYKALNIQLILEPLKLH